ncbi:hypothetical protein DLM86_01935 [Paenibacillus flagellatus]|uniref:Uncharacterized protein n=1 Tax=Paenibacillus flagellatus TaxID=2211139 RepID=A0A2V5KXM8_9BACL|nr:hypothetical protein DLM86_01935 [Paenibacillus flagellatus]
MAENRYFAVVPALPAEPPEEESVLPVESGACLPAPADPDVGLPPEEPEEVPVVPEVDPEAGLFESEPEEPDEPLPAEPVDEPEEPVDPLVSAEPLEPLEPVEPDVPDFEESVEPPVELPPGLPDAGESTLVPPVSLFIAGSVPPEHPVSIAAPNTPTNKAMDHFFLIEHSPPWRFAARQSSFSKACASGNDGPPDAGCVRHVSVYRGEMNKR